MIFGKSRCVSRLSMKMLGIFLYDSYNVCNVLENEKSAICARIYCIQRFHLCSHL